MKYHMIKCSILAVAKQDSSGLAWRPGNLERHILNANKAGGAQFWRKTVWQCHGPKCCKVPAPILPKKKVYDIILWSPTLLVQLPIAIMWKVGGANPIPPTYSAKMSIFLPAMRKLLKVVWNVAPSIVTGASYHVDISCNLLYGFGLLPNSRYIHRNIVFQTNNFF